MKNTHTVMLAGAILALTACSSSNETASTEPTATTETTTSSSAASASPTNEETATEEIVKVGQSQAYSLIETDESVLSVTVESVEAISGDQCTTSYFDGVPEGKQLVRLSVSAEAGTKEAIEKSEIGTDSLGFWSDDWGWIDAEGYKIQQPVNNVCIDRNEEPATSLAPGQKTRGQIILEVAANDNVAAGKPYFEAHWAGFPLEWEQ